jgi:hypothetical protein
LTRAWPGRELPTCRCQLDEPIGARPADLRAKGCQSGSCDVVVGRRPAVRVAARLFSPGREPSVVQLLLQASGLALRGRRKPHARGEAPALNPCLRGFLALALEATRRKRRELRSSGKMLLSPGLPRRRLRRFYHPVAWLAAHLFAPWIDRQLAEGVAPWRSRTHAARALQLTNSRRRRVLAAGLERLVEHAEQPGSHFRHSGVIPPCREQVREALPVIFAIAGRLRGGSPLDARGVARLKALITDSAGPCYKRSRRDALNDALETVSQWLDTPG